MEEVKKRVCIIGAGAAGLVALKHVISAPNLEGTVFEQSDHIGGIWDYTDAIGPKSNWSPMYQGLRTNLPKEIMGFLDFPFLNNGRGTHSVSYVNHSDVLSYLQAYAAQFQLKHHIQFNKRVIRVKPIFPSPSPSLEDPASAREAESESTPKWHVLVHSTQTSTETRSSEEKVDGIIEEQYIFDSVIVCNGHFVRPIIPDIPNITEFQGEVVHSQDYRVPDVYEGKRVLIVGAGPSGVDISLEIAQVATEVIISLRNPPLQSTFPSNVRQTLPIKSATGRNAFIFENDETAVDVDAVIFCSGYAYDFPFLDPECRVTVEQGKLVTPLFRHMIHTQLPTLCFIGLPFRVCPFILFDCQVRYFVKYLRGLIRLPTEEEMNAEREEDKSLRKMMGLSLKASHQLGQAQWQYFQTLAEEADFVENLVGPTIPPVSMEVVKEIYENTEERRRRFVGIYRNDVVHIIDEKRHEYCPAI